MESDARVRVATVTRELKRSFHKLAMEKNKTMSSAKKIEMLTSIDEQMDAIAAMSQPPKRSKPRIFGPWAHWRSRPQVSPWKIRGLLVPWAPCWPHNRSTLSQSHWNRVTTWCINAFFTRCTMTVFMKKWLSRSSCLDGFMQNRISKTVVTRSTKNVKTVTKVTREARTLM